MRRGILAFAACAVLAGCGSSNHTSSSAGSSSGGTAATTGGPGSATPTSSLKVTGTPKFGRPPSSAPVQSGQVRIAYRNIAIHPDTLRVKVGSTIRWTNDDSIEHNVTSEGGPQAFKSNDFGGGGTFAITAQKPGLIHYECTIHPASMNGTIEVVR